MIDRRCNSSVTNHRIAILVPVALASIFDALRTNLRTASTGIDELRELRATRDLDKEILHVDGDVDRRRYQATMTMLRRHTSIADSCGQETARKLKMSGCAVEKDCDRSYSLFVPSSRCDPIHEEGNVLPFVFALHCLGCSPQQMKHWVSIAEQFSFVLVIPEGIHNSWNARYCCGYALEQDLDDFGFLRGIVEELSQEFSFVSQEVTYAVGWSNGGYMATFAADMFRAVAPISGHDYEPSISKPTSLFMHHSSNDQYVQITGCCTNATMPRCCCGISNHAETCTSTVQVFEGWASEINMCKGGVNVSLDDAVNGVTCHTGIDCVVNTTFCVHRDSGHFNRPSFEKAFPMTNEVAHFFARDACAIHHGTWSSEWRNCSCQLGGGYGGTFCLAPSAEKVQSSPTVNSQQVVTVSSSLLVLTGLALLGGLVVLIKSKLRVVGWTRLPTSDARSVLFLALSQ